MASGKTNPITHLIDGIIIAFGGTNKEKKKFGIKIIFTMIVVYAIVWLGLRFIGYTPKISNINIIFETIFSHIIMVIIGITLLIFSVGWGAVMIIDNVFLLISSLVGLIKGKENDGKPLPAFLVNLIALVIIVIVPLVFII